MSKTYEVQGYYGVSSHHPCTILVYEKRDGGKWYVTEGSENVNLTYDDITLGTDVEALNDVDTFSWEVINTLEELEQAVES